MHGPINLKSPNNISKWQMGFNSAFKGLNKHTSIKALTYRAPLFKMASLSELDIEDFMLPRTEWVPSACEVSEMLMGICKLLLTSIYRIYVRHQQRLDYL
jgi:hypothetical protein